jgi:hypothetical protein
MRPAPPVCVTVVQPLAVRLGVALLAGLAAASGLAWMAGHVGLSAGWGWLGAPLAALWGWQATARAGLELAWDGQRFTLDGSAGVPAVQIVLQRGLLLRWRGEAGPRRPRWLVIDTQQLGPAAGPLRVALLAGAQPSPPPSPPLVP